MKILIIDDSEIARAQLRDILECKENEIFELPSAIGATRELLEHEIEIAVVDVSMPGLSGDKLVGVLRGNRRFKDLIIILISARSQGELNLLSQNIDANAVMPKEDIERKLLPLIRRLKSVSARTDHRIP